MPPSPWWRLHQVDATRSPPPPSTSKMGPEPPQVGQPRPGLGSWGFRALPPPHFGSSKPRPKNVNWSWDVQASATLWRYHLWLAPGPRAGSSTWRMRLTPDPSGDTPGGGSGAEQTEEASWSCRWGQGGGRAWAGVLSVCSSGGRRGRGAGGGSEAGAGRPLPSPSPRPCWPGWVMRQWSPGAGRALVCAAPGLATDPSPPLSLVPPGWRQGLGESGGVSLLHSNRRRWPAGRVGMSCSLQRGVGLWSL